jgi:hypothetical protein
MMFLKGGKNFSQISEVVKYMGHDRGYGIDSANGPHSAWR